MSLLWVSVTLFIRLLQALFLHQHEFKLGFNLSDSLNLTLCIGFSVVLIKRRYISFGGIYSVEIR